MNEYELDNKHLIFQHVIYELLRHKDLKRRANKGFNEQILDILSVISAYSIHFNILKSGLNQKYIFFINEFNLKAPKWVGLIEEEKNTPICFFWKQF